MRRVYVTVSGLLLLAILAQFYFAAVGSFAKPQDDKSFALHDLNGTLIVPLLSVLATVAAALARAPGRLVGLTILPLGLVVVQMVIVAAGRAVSGGTEDTTTPAGLAILGLHAINGLAMMGVAGFVLRRARAHAASPSPSSASTPSTTAA